MESLEVEFHDYAEKAEEELLERHQRQCEDIQKKTLEEVNIIIKSKEDVIIELRNIISQHNSHTAQSKYIFPSRFHSCV